MSDYQRQSPSTVLFLGGGGNSNCSEANAHLPPPTELSLLNGSPCTVRAIIAMWSSSSHLLNTKQKQL